MRTSTFSWQVPEVKTLLEKLWMTDGLSASLCANQISIQFGAKVTRNAVIGASHRYGWKRPRRPVQSKPLLGNRFGRPRPPRPVPAPPKRRPIVKIDEEIVTVIECKLPNGRLRLRFTEWNSKTPMCDQPPPDVVVVPLLQLSDNVCHYPFGDPGTPTFGFCGRPKLDSLPYCARCAMWVYMPPGQRRQRPTHYTPGRHLRT